MKTDQFIALVLAADRATNDPVAGKTGVACKAIAPICGTPMIIRVLDALEASDMVKTIVILGPPASILPDCPELEDRIKCGRVFWLPNLDSPSRSANSGLEQIDQDAPVLLTTADHALLTPSIVQYFLSKSLTAHSDATVGVVKHEDVAAAFPGVKRTVIRLQDGGVCGCNLYAFLNHRGRGVVSFWQRAEELRKRPWLLISRTFGFMTVLSYLLGILTVDKGLKAVLAKTGIKVRPVFLPYPQAGVDVDKVEDMLLVESVLAGAAPLAQEQADSHDLIP
ncbi:MobA-like NTP transferase domain-containing protein [Nitrosospira sp. Nsp11]|uniref:nucleotidyltransferase family protein n=1 Tax=Nitrosospira sp. Nsp11 TaxID=1855338 RepID=UPI000912AA9D|nr:nucleotidyltransferase family protein [Nitrosospira sp. Nsp11]SHM09370.1 MobA-like NTP transferase domain-containing protein [Nitrosospira sp. Nsp11]